MQLNFTNNSKPAYVPKYYTELQVPDHMKGHLNVDLLQNLLAKNGHNQYPLEAK